MNYLRHLIDELEAEEEENEEVGRHPRAPRRIYQRADPVNYFSDEEFKIRFRMDKESVASVLEALKCDLEYSCNR